MDRIERRVPTRELYAEIQHIEREGHYEWISIRAEADVCVIVLEQREPRLETRA